MPFTLIVGPMKSSKSLELISRVSPHEFSNKKVIYVQNNQNVRDNGIKSRLGLNVAAIKVGSLSEIKDDFDILAIDEINMFNARDAKQIKKWIKKDRNIFASGLDLDYRGKMIPIIKKLLELKPNQLVNKVAVCDVCHQYGAQFTQILDKDITILGGLPYIVPEDNTYVYEARCRNCFIQK
jgi:thymidine kinase